MCVCVCVYVVSGELVAAHSLNHSFLIRAKRSSLLKHNICAHVHSHKTMQSSIDGDGDDASIASARRADQSRASQAVDWA